MKGDWNGRLDTPPPQDAYVRLPESFGRRFILFVDTEEEFDWNGPFLRQNRATTAMAAMPDMHRRMRAAGAKPVYLVDHPIATDPKSIDILRPWLERRECTIGTQLHPWVNPPFEEEVTPFNSFTGNLPVELQRAKLHALTDAIEKGFGQRPTVYRAGRYGIGPATASLLQEAGYTMDVSVRALFDYRPKHGPDFSRIQPLPYWAGDGTLLELPLGAAYTGALRAFGPALHAPLTRVPHLGGIFARAHLLNRVALTPEDMPLPQVLDAIALLLDEGVQILSISFHSPSVEAGHTPYVRDAADLALFHAWWDGLFNELAKRGVTAASLEEILAAAQSVRTSRATDLPSTQRLLSAGAAPGGL